MTKQHLKTKIKENTLKPIDIIDKIKDTPKSKITKEKKAIVLLKRASGKSQNEIKEEENISRTAIIGIEKNNKELKDQIVQNQASITIEQDQRILKDMLLLLQSKVNTLKDNPKKLELTRLTELTTAIKDTFNKIQLQQGEPTSITANKALDTKALELKVLKTAKLIKNDNKVELMEATFNNDDDQPTPTPPEK